MGEMWKNEGQLLVFEDDSAHALHLRNTLKRDYRLTTSRDDRNFIKLALTGEYDLVIVAASGPRLAEICKSLGQYTPSEWIPMIAMSDNIEDRIVALESGAIDCLAMNVDHRELMLKLESFIRCKRIHDRVRQSEIDTKKKIGELESFIEMVVHDLKSPVIAIHGFIAMLEKHCTGLPPDEKRKEILSNLSSTSRKVQQFVEDLAKLLISEEIQLQFSEISLRAAIEEVIRRHQQIIEDKSISVQVSSGDNLARVTGDERRIIEVLDNLFSNALNYMGDGPGLRIEICLQEMEDAVLTRVSDNGVGIPEQYHDKVFDRFFRVPATGAKPGTGLGLAIVKTIVESHGGKIWLESNSGQGTTFNFTLPKDRTASGAQRNGAVDYSSLSA